MEAEAPSYNIESLRRMVETFGERIEVATVSELSERGVIFVEDGNHGENRPRQDEFAATGIAFLRPPDLKDGRVDFQSCSRINDAGFKRVRKGIGRRGDIILTHRATVGRIAITDDDAPEVFVTNPGTTIWRSTDPNVLDQRFLYCFMRSAAFMDQLWSQVGNNSTFDYVSLTQQRGLRVAYPPIAEQKAIAAVLGALDDKIELNRRMNATLEEMARALFQSWFVDFDPVRAKMDGGEPVGMNPEIAALFPDSFQDSEAGHIPMGWSIQPVGDVVDCVGGGTPSTTEPKYWEGGMHHWATPKDLSSLRAPVLLDTARKLTDTGIARISSGLLPAGTLLLSSRAPVGYLAITAMPVAINQGFIALKCNERASSTFMLGWCQANMAEIEGRATGTTFAEISKQNFRHIPVVLPPIELMAAYTAKVAPLYAQITANLHQSRTLESLRDSLLPQLLSGELSVAAAQETMEVIK